MSGMDIDCGKENLKINNIFDYLKFKLNFSQEHPDYFDPDGLLIFIGPQGSGKTLTAVNYVYKLLDKYPKCKICTNLMLDSYPMVTLQQFKDKNNYLIDDLIQNTDDEKYVDKLINMMYLKENRVFPFVDNDDFKKYGNGEHGIIFLVDEIQLYLNSLESKNVNMETMTVISQQRKQRIHIVSTSQVFGRMAKPLREQFTNVVVCKNFFGFMQRNYFVDRDSIDGDNSADTKITGKVKKKFVWFHNPRMYKRYDTFAVIEKGKFVGGEKQKEGLYDARNIKLSGNN